MSSHQQRWIRASVLFSLGILGIGAAHADTPQYRLTDLSRIGINQVVDLNNAGDVLGTNAPPGVALPGASTGGSNPLPSPPDAPLFDSRGSVIVARDGHISRVMSGVPVAINDSGQITGYSFVGSSNATTPFFYDGSTVHDLGTESGIATATINGLNNAGTVLGTRADQKGIFTVTNGARTDYGTFGGFLIDAVGINNAGAIIGGVEPTQGTQTNAFILQNGTLTIIPTPAGFAEIFPRAINNAGQVIGFHRNFSVPSSRAFLFANGAYSDLGPSLSSISSIATDINDAGQIVGSMNSSGPPTGDPFLYSAGTLYNINDIVIPSPDWLRVQSAVSINNLGQFIGYATRADGTTVPVLATPVTTTAVPLPAAAWPAAATLSLLACAGAARRSASADRSQRPTASPAD
jgi:probable HAF family extracellular repeat protein